MNHKPDALTLGLPSQQLRGDQQRLVPGQSGKSVPGPGRDHTVAGAESLDEALARCLSSQTPSLLPFVERIAVAAKHDFTVLLSGETGTGKTFLARLIHEHSPRRNHHFLEVPCGAIAGNLIESELFGHARGAFTGADRHRIGKFLAAGEGTLFLDEIDTLGLEQQATILRVVETGEFEPVGSNETQKCLARLIVTSNVDLEAAVEVGTFRPDLYYRLNVMSFYLPPLRTRVEDILPLVRGMVARFSRRFRRDVHDVSAEALACLEAFPWPGNIRQLENVIQHAVLVSAGPDLRFEHLPEAVREHALIDPNSIVRALPKVPLFRELERAEREIIHTALIQHEYRRARTAEFLGISRVALFKKMRKYNLMSIPE
jgi:transcriptional regulator with PAS, ATPase and Fis domain